MHSVIEKMRDCFEYLPVFLLRHRLIIWLLIIASTVFMGFGVTRVVVDTSMDAVFPKGHPVRETYVDFRKQFGSDSGLGILYRAKDGNVFSEKSLEVLQSIHNELIPYRDNAELREKSPLKHIELITDLINVGFLESQEGEVIIARNFIGRELPASQSERNQLKSVALKHPNYPGVYVNEDASFATIIIGTDFGAVPKGFERGADFIHEDELTFGELDTAIVGTVERTMDFEAIDSEQCADFMRAIKAILEKPEYTDHFEFHYVGDVAMQAFDHDVIGPEVMVIFSTMLLVFFGVLFFLFKNVVALVWALVIDVLTVVWTLGIIGWSGVAMSELINPLMLLVLVVGLADAVHILSGYIYKRRENIEHFLALRQVMRKSGLACFLTSITTAVGFASLATVELVELRVFGIFAAIGVTVGFFLSCTLLPLLIDLRTPVTDARLARRPGHAEYPLMKRYLDSVNYLVTSHPRKIVGVFALLVALCIPGIANIRVDTNPLEALKTGTTVRKDAEMMENHLTGTQGMHILLNMNRSDAFKDLKVLKAVDRLERSIESHPSGLVDTAGSIGIGIKNSYQALKGGDPVFYALPDDENLIKQLLFLFQNAHPESNRKLVSDDYSLAHIQLTLKNRGSAEYVSLMEDINAEIEREMRPLRSIYPDMEVRFTGSLAIQMEMYDMMSWAQIKSFGLAFIVITVLMLVLFGSARVGLLSMVPNIVPVVVVFGTLGWFDIPLDVVALIIAPIVIGIVVDDTIHFSSSFKAEVFEHGDVGLAVKNTINEVGQALIFTTLTICLGLLCLMYSSHMGFTYLGVIGSLSIFIALLADLYLFPALCVIFKPGLPVRVNSIPLMTEGSTK